MTMTVTMTDPRDRAGAGDAGPRRARGAPRRRVGLPAAAAVAAVVVLVGGCSSDSDQADGDGAATTVTAAADDTTTTTAAAGPTTVEITAVDYAFEGVPETVASGSTLSLTTEEGGEPHEIVAVGIAETETRSAEELASLPDAELEALFTEPPALVTIALPGTTDEPGPVVGDGTLGEPGRYLLVCTFPQGTTVEDVESAEGPLQGDRLHYTLGMFGELVVE